MHYQELLQYLRFHIASNWYKSKDTFPSNDLSVTLTERSSSDETLGTALEVIRRNEWQDGKPLSLVNQMVRYANSAANQEVVVAQEAQQVIDQFRQSYKEEIEYRLNSFYFPSETMPASRNEAFNQEDELFAAMTDYIEGVDPTVQATDPQPLPASTGTTPVFDAYTPEYPQGPAANVMRGGDLFLLPEDPDAALADSPPPALGGALNQGESEVRAVGVRVREEQEEMRQPVAKRPRINKESRIANQLLGPKVSFMEYVESVGNKFDNVPYLETRVPPVLPLGDEVEITLDQQDPRYQQYYRGRGNGGKKDVTDDEFEDVGSLAVYLPDSMIYEYNLRLRLDREAHHILRPLSQEKSEALLNGLLRNIDEFKRQYELFRGRQALNEPGLEEPEGDYDEEQLVDILTKITPESKTRLSNFLYYGFQGTLEKNIKERRDFENMTVEEAKSKILWRRNYLFKVFKINIGAEPIDEKSFTSKSAKKLTDLFKTTEKERTQVLCECKTKAGLPVYVGLEELAEHRKKCVPFLLTFAQRAWAPANAKLRSWTPQ